MKRLVLVFIVMVQAIASSAQSTLRVDAPKVVASDEQFNVTFIIEGDDNPTDFSWSPGDDFQLVWGPQTGRSVSTQIVGGKRTRSSQYTYTYILMPRKAGNFTLPTARATFKGGKEMTSEDIRIEVVSGGSSSSGSQGSSSGQSSRGSSQTSQGNISDSDIFLRFTLSRSSAVIGEPITAVLKLYQRVNIVGFEDARFPSFNGFWSQEVEAPTNIEFQRESLDGEIYNTAVLRRYVLMPQQAGTITIDPAELVCLVNVRVASSGGASIFDGFFDDYRTIRKRVSSEACRVNVKSLPSGAPATFGGGVGSFSISASLSKDSLQTHEAASLKITVRGRGNVSLLEAPKVSFPPDMEVYDTKVSENIDRGTGGTSGSKVYEFPFIPRSHGDFEIPPVKYSYYDVNSGKYVTLETPAIRYHVERGTDFASQSGQAGVAVPGRSGVKSLNEDIRYIRTTMPKFTSSDDFFILSSGYWIWLAILLAASCGTFIALRKYAARKADVVGARTRKANKVAVRRLKQSGEYLKQGLYTAFYEELHKALLGYISDKLNIASGDLSAELIQEELLKHGVSHDVTEDFLSLLDACQFARFSPDAGNEAMNEHYGKAVSLISELESRMKGIRNNNTGVRTGGGAAMIALALMTLSLSAHASENTYIDSLWTASTQAYAEGRWQDALDGYSMIEKAGLESAALFCNIGDSWYKLEHYPQAILYYERALKLDPSYSDARYNLDIASEFIQDKIDPVPEFILSSWLRSMCYWLGSNAWAVLSLVFFVLLAVCVMLYVFGHSSGLRKTGFFTGIVMLLFTVGAFSFSLWQKADYEKADSAIVIRPVTSVKSAPSTESSTDLFILHEGTKVTIIDEVGSWRNISLADGRQGWMLSADMEVI